MRIYISQEKNMKTETLAQAGIRMNDISASLTHADYEGPILVNQRLRTGYASSSFSILTVFVCCWV
jgi:hypothetical protein